MRSPEDETLATGELLDVHNATGVTSVMTPSLRTVVAFSWLVWPTLKAASPVTVTDVSVGADALPREDDLYNR